MNNKFQMIKGEAPRSFISDFDLSKLNDAKVYTSRKKTAYIEFSHDNGLSRPCVNYKSVMNLHYTDVASGGSGLFVNDQGTSAVEGEEATLNPNATIACEAGVLSL